MVDSNKTPSPTIDKEPNCLSFVADNHFEAVRQVQAQVGLDAVVVNTRQIPARGLSRLWRKPRVELTVRPRSPQTSNKEPDEIPLPTAPSPLHTGNQSRSILNVYGHTGATPQAQTRKRTPVNVVERLKPETKPQTPAATSNSPERRCEQLLHKIGLDEILVARVCDEAASHFAQRSSVTNRQLLDFCRTRFARIWPTPRSSYLDEEKPVVLLGAPGCGKTTLIGKWVSLLALKTSVRPRIWKLDGLRANTDEFLNFIADLHHIPVTRMPDPQLAPHPKEVLFIDIPGIDWNDPQQMKQLQYDLTGLPPANQYLVLNAAYHTDVLKRQIRAYSEFPIQGLILTHLDEERRWSKILNIMIGTKFPLHIVSGGQNIPGYFQAADTDNILSQVFPTNDPTQR